MRINLNASPHHQNNNHIRNTVHGTPPPPPPPHKGGAYLGIMPGSVKEVLRRLERTKTNRTADTTGMAEQESWVS